MRAAGYSRNRKEPIMTIIHHSKVKPEDWPSKYFSPAEVACRGTGMVMLSPASIDALKRLDRVREAMGHPLILNSGYRSPEHNRAVGGAKASNHMKGIAFDINMSNVDPHRFEAEAKRAGFNGIGLYPPQKPTGSRDFIHIDTRKAPWRGTQWGEFPKRATRFAPEQAPTPVRDSLRDAGPVMAAGAAVEASLQAAQPALREAAPWLPENVQGYAMLAAIAIGLGLAIWGIFNRRNRGE
jgi:zinc D-Ala-D-Ala carboxypeptidase